MDSREGIPGTGVQTRDTVITAPLVSTIVDPRYTNTPGVPIRIMSWEEYFAIRASDTGGSGFFGDLSSALDRLFTVRPQSFTPGNIVRSITAGTLAVYTGGLSVTSPEVNGVTLVTSDTNKPAIANAAYIGGLSYGQVRVGDPSLPESFYNKIARIIGGAYSAFATGSIASSWLSASPTVVNAVPATYEGPPLVQPLSLAQKFGNTVGLGISSSASAYGSSQIAQVVIGVFGQKVGGAILSIFSGNVSQAIQILTSNPSTQTPNLFGPSGGSSSSSAGGGGGFLPSQNTGQSQMSSAIIPIIGISLIGLILWYFLRKKA